jgi:hypothetical protein
MAFMFWLQHTYIKDINSPIFTTVMMLHRSFVDQYSTSESSRSPEHARRFARVSACLSALEGILKGSSSFSPIRRLVYNMYCVKFTNRNT